MTTTEPASHAARQVSATVRTPRGRRGLAAGITSAVAVLAFAATAVEAISLARHRTLLGLDVATVARFGRRTRLGDPVVEVIALVAIVLGLLLIAAALLPARRGLVELSEADTLVAVGVSRRGLRRTLAAAATRVDGIDSASVSGRRRIAVRATTSLRNADALTDRVRDRVSGRLSELDPVTARPVRVTLKRKDA